MGQTEGDNLAEFGAAADPRLVELVAYLDGELDEVAVDEMERRLVDDEPLRQNAEMLDKTWRMLNTLEEMPASGEFTQRTLASMSAPSLGTLTDVADGETVANPGRVPLLKILMTFALSFVLASAGLLAGRWYSATSSNPDDVQMLQNMSLLERYSLYRPIPSVEFLKNLEIRSKPDMDEEIR